MVIFVLKSPHFSMNFHENSKNKNRKINFSFDSAHRASFMKMRAQLRGGEGVCISLLGTGPLHLLVTSKIGAKIFLLHNEYLFFVEKTTLTLSPAPPTNGVRGFAPSPRPRTLSYRYRVSLVGVSESGSEKSPSPKN